MSKNELKVSNRNLNNRERGAALAVALIVVAILSVVALTALAFSSSEARIAGSDLQRAQTFYATTAAIEKMTNDFSNLFLVKLRPTAADLNTISNSPPPALDAEGFVFSQVLEEDTARLNELRAIQGLPNTVYPRVNIPDGTYAGLYSTVVPYRMVSTGTMTSSGAQIELRREFNNYLVPLFQFGIYSNEDLEFSPGPLTTFNGRIHSNRNIYALRNIKFLNRVSMAGELVRAVTRNGDINNAAGNDQVLFEVNGINVRSTLGSVQAGGGGNGGPNFPAATNGQRGFHPGSPNGAANPNWESESVRPADGGNNRFGGNVLTNTTGASELKTPLELAGNSPAELIKRSLTSDTEILAVSRYHNKAQVRILIDDETAGSGAANVAGIPAGKGVQLADFKPDALGGNGEVLKMIDDAGAISGATVRQLVSLSPLTVQTAKSVRRVNAAEDETRGYYIPGGSGIRGRILIEIIKPDGTALDVTQKILSMGVTVGEPNSIIGLQRPLWMSYVQGSRDRTPSGTFNLARLVNQTQIAADGEISDPAANFEPSRGFIRNTADDDVSFLLLRGTAPTNDHNDIVPINVYNVREGWFQNSLDKYNVYPERGITSVVELNMRNLARWLDGAYDNNLLAGTDAVSANIKGTEGYVVYLSDRRGDKIGTEYLNNGTAYESTNGTVDNEDIYGLDGILQPGEDVIDYGYDALLARSKKGTLQKNLSELPDASVPYTVSATPTFTERKTRMDQAMRLDNRYFRRAVRLFNGEKLTTTGAANKLSQTKGITVASENMVYIWGNFNTSGVTGIPSGGSSLNPTHYSGAQVPASIVCDAFFPLSKTWFDGLSAAYPEGSSIPDTRTGDAYRMADENLPSIGDGTAVRAGIIAGTTISTSNGLPGRTSAGLRNSGGIVNYPRFLEMWNSNTPTYVENPWSYSGSFIPLFRSTQAIAQWESNTSSIYLPPRRNWSFDSTFLDPNRLPPGTPFFQYVQATGFRQVLR